MLDPKFVRQNKHLVELSYQKRHQSLDDLDNYVTLDHQWRLLLQEVDSLKSERNQLMPKGKPSTEQLRHLKHVSETIKSKQAELQILAEKVKEAALYLPNVLHESVPDGQSEDDNIVVKSSGDIPSFDFSVLPHEELGQQLGILDFDGGVSVTGGRFVCLRGDGARLERALSQFMLDEHQKHGYEEILPPVVVNTDSLRGTGQLPKFSDDQFHLQESDFWLSPTAEVQLTNLYKDSIITESSLPISLTAATSCFRKESFSHGKDVKGLIRLHQFTKVELVKIVSPEESMDQLEALLSHAEALLKLLKLPYRIVELCGADVGFSSGKTYDLEVWFPFQNKYREISSCSNFFDFQARRAMIRYKSNQMKDPQYVHTINGSGLAVGRTMAAILENYQLSDGSVKIPDVLVDYMKKRYL